MAQVAHVVLGFIWAFGITYVIFTVAKQFIKLRVSPQVELEGLDMSEFGSVCYPDFVLAQSAMSPGHAPSSGVGAGESAPDASPEPALGGDRA
jgi:Amt family ammonium transporter